MSSTANPDKAKVLAGLRALIAGTQKNTPNDNLTFGGATYAAAALIQLLQSLVNAYVTHDDAVATAKDLLLALRDVKAKVGPVVRDYKRFLRAKYGNATQTLGDYGLAPEKARTPLTGEQTVAAAQKSKATRKLRGTLGKKQKAEIKATTVPAETPAAPATPAVPKPTA